MVMLFQILIRFFAGIISGLRSGTAVSVERRIVLADRQKTVVAGSSDQFPGIRHTTHPAFAGGSTPYQICFKLNYRLSDSLCILRTDSADPKRSGVCTNAGLSLLRLSQKLWRRAGGKTLLIPKTSLGVFRGFCFLFSTFYEKTQK